MADRGKIRQLASGREQPVADRESLTAKDDGTVNSGDGTTDGVIENNRTRIDELEAQLVDLGLLNESGTA